MTAELLKVLKMKHFFKLQNCTENIISYSLRNPSTVLLKNIYVNWLRFLLSKTQNKGIQILLNKSCEHFIDTKSYYGYIKGKLPIYDDKTILIINPLNFGPEYQSVCEFNLVLPNEEIMQNFIQWQRYRKYWWSSITTTPSLFASNDVKCDNIWANTDVIAKFPWGPQPVERIKIINRHKNCSHISCSMSLEYALITLLLDGMANNSEKEYLRLHRKMTPFKLSFSLNYTDNSKKKNLCDLATLIYQKLDTKNIKAWLPSFSIDYSSQIRENLHMGVTYTIILEETTLQNGILYLLNSSTMLREEVHISDLNKYAATLFKS